MDKDHEVGRRMPVNFGPTPGKFMSTMKRIR